LRYIYVLAALIGSKIATDRAFASPSAPILFGAAGRDFEIKA
tara:strand:- start:708 stop:833 length:126 start_codon:yes stop_codon:yes gene_type:complete